MKNISKKGWKIISWLCMIAGVVLFGFSSWIEGNPELFDIVNQWINTESFSWIGIVMAVGGFILIVRIDDLYDEYR